LLKLERAHVGDALADHLTWTPEQDDLPKRLGVKGVSALRAAAALERPVNGIQARARVLGLSFAGVGEICRKLHPPCEAKAIMSDYRAYIVSSDGQFQTSEVTIADDDAQDRPEVCRRSRCRVWQHDRKIRVLRTGQPSSTCAVEITAGGPVGRWWMRA
jgi:hypothetical protein